MALRSSRVQLAINIFAILAILFIGVKAHDARALRTEAASELKIFFASLDLAFGHSPVCTYLLKGLQLPDDRNEESVEKIRNIRPGVVFKNWKVDNLRVSTLPVKERNAEIGITFVMSMKEPWSRFLKPDQQSHEVKARVFYEGSDRRVIECLN